MKIETKFNIGDRTYCIYNNRIYFGEIQEISYRSYNYILDNNGKIKEKLFDIYYTFKIDEFGYYFFVREKDVYKDWADAEYSLNFSGTTKQ